MSNIAISRNLPQSYRSAKPSVSFRNTQAKSQVKLTNKLFDTKSVGGNSTANKKQSASSNVTKRITFKDERGSITNNDYNSQNHPPPVNSMNNMLQNILLKQTKRVKSNQQSKRGAQNDMSYFVKEAQFYFEKNPTYLKEVEVGEDAKNFELQKYVQTIGVKRNPIFGFPHIQFEENDRSPEVIKERRENFNLCLIGATSPSKKPIAKKLDFQKVVGQDSSDDESSTARTGKTNLPFRQALNQKRKDDRIFNHIMKCFTFGKKVKRQMEDDADRISRVEILKKRFQRLSLLREYFSVTKRDLPRKFKYPVQEDAAEALGKPLQIYDEIQYCEESDIEEYIKPKKQKVEEQIIEEPDDISHSLDIDFLESARSRLDIKGVSTVAKKLDNQNKNLLGDNVSSDDDTFKGLSDSDSVHSSPRHRVQQELMAYDRLMPFDFHTHRKTKCFFKDELLNIDSLLNNFEHSIKEVDLLPYAKSKDRIQFDENEDAKMREVPERNEQLKQMYSLRPSPMEIVPRKQQTRNQRITTQSQQQKQHNDSHTLDNYKYAEKVQATQVRNAYNDLKQLIFQRSQTKNLRQKRQLLEQVVSFKQRISPIQIEALKARQFVIVDVAMPPAPQSTSKKREDIFVGKDADQIQTIKAKIVREKKIQIENISQQRNEMHSKLQKQILIKNSRQMNNSQMLTAVSATPSILFRNQASVEQLQGTRNMFDTPGQSSLSSIPRLQFQISKTSFREDSTIREEAIEGASSKEPVAKNYQQLINESPYTDILNPLHNFGIGKNGKQTMGVFHVQNRIRKFMPEKLRRRSILNCELFKETNQGDTKAKTLYMTEKIGQILGIKIGNNPPQYQQQPQRIRVTEFMEL